MHLVTAYDQPSIPNKINNAIPANVSLPPILGAVFCIGSTGMYDPGRPASPGNGLNVEPEGGGRDGLYAPDPLRASCCSCVSIPRTS